MRASLLLVLMGIFVSACGAPAQDLCRAGSVECSLPPECPEGYALINDRSCGLVVRPSCEPGWSWNDEVSQCEPGGAGTRPGTGPGAEAVDCGEGYFWVEEDQTCWPAQAEPFCYDGILVEDEQGRLECIPFDEYWDGYGYDDAGDDPSDDAADSGNGDPHGGESSDAPAPSEEGDAGGANLPEQDPTPPAEEPDAGGTNVPVDPPTTSDDGSSNDGGGDSAIKPGTGIIVTPQCPEGTTWIHGYGCVAFFFGK